MRDDGWLVGWLMVALSARPRNQTLKSPAVCCVVLQSIGRTHKHKQRVGGFAEREEKSKFIYLVFGAVVSQKSRTRNGKRFGRPCVAARMKGYVIS